jgi:hypothetical protein
VEPDGSHKDWAWLFGTGAMNDYLQRTRSPFRSCITRDVMSEAPGTKPSIVSVSKS